MRPRQAYAYLCDLLENRPGYLRVITSTPDPAGAHYLESDPRHYIAHDVVKIEPFSDLLDINRPGWLRSYTAEGDMCDGSPFGLLKALTRYVRASQMFVLYPLVEKPLPWEVRKDVLIQAETAEARFLIRG